MNLLELTKRSAFFLLFIITSILISCENPKNIGLSNLPNPNGQIGVFFRDSFNLQPKTVLLDSLITAESFTGLVGQYKDPIFGDIKAKAFWDVGPTVVLGTDTIALSGSNRKLTSLKLQLALTYTYGVDFKKNNTPQTIEIYELKDTLTGNRRYLNSETVAYDNTKLLATSTFAPQTIIDAGGVLEIAITDTDYTQRIFDVANAGGSSKDFLNQVKGIAIVFSRNNSNAVVGFDRANLNTKLVLGYSAESNGSATDFTYDMRFVGQAFNNIISENRSGVLANLTTSNREVDGGKLMYAQAGVGIVSRIDLIDVLKLKEVEQAKGGNISINKAELIFSSPLSTISEQAIRNPGHLMLVQANGFNYNRRSDGFFDILVNEEAPGRDRFESNLTLFNSTFKNYTYNITSQLQQMLNGTRGTQIFVIPSFTTNINNVNGVLGGGNVTRSLLDIDTASKRNIQLKVFYTVIQQ